MPLHSRVMLLLTRADRLASLADALTTRLYAAPADDDLAAERIVVASLGHARWLRARIAQRFGIAAHLTFGFPAQTLWALAAQVVPGVAQRSPFDPTTLAWRLLRLLDRAVLRDDPVFAPVVRYLDGARHDPLARMHLADRLATAFDDLAAYRPDDWLAAWRRGHTVGLPQAHTEAWVAALWRALSDDLQLTDPRHPLDRFAHAIAHDPTHARARLPSRVRVFACGTLPPLYRRAFEAMSRVIDIEWYALEPTADYIADLASPARLARWRATDDPRAQHAESGHALLASWGRLAMEQNAMLLALADLATETDDHFAPPHDDAHDTVLHALQRSVRTLDERIPLRLNRDDRSLVIHACTSLERQLEALHDDLLARFDADATLQPYDVVVFVPDIDAARGAIDTVFGQAPVTVPMRVTGGRVASDEPLLTAWDAWLDLATSRDAIEPVLAVLRTPACARRFGLDDAALASIAPWMREAGVRWGLDAAHRAQFDVPADARSTWAWALERLVLGAALAPHDAPGSLGVPLDARVRAGLEGEVLVALGGLLRCLHAIERLHREAQRDRPVAAWMAWFTDRLDDAFAPDIDDAPAVQRLRDAIAAIGDAAREARFDAPVPFAVARDRLARALTEHAPGAVPTGAVTFAPLGTLRGVPYRVIAVLGLDDGVFPRAVVPIEFDLVAAHPRAGDRHPRDEDRAALLDALLAAGDALVLGTTARNERDNAPRPPSVLLDELVDTIAAQAGLAREAAWQALVRAHPLHGFAPEAFAPTRDAPSYVAAWAEVAQVLARGTQARPRLAAPQPLPRDPAAPRRLDFTALVRWLAHPARDFLRDCVGAACAPQADAHDDDEPFALDGPSRWAVTDRVRAMIEAGLDADEVDARARADAAVPAGVAGVRAVRALHERVEAAIEAARRCDVPWGPALPARAFTFEHAGWTLDDTVDGLRGDAQGVRGHVVSANTLLRAVTASSVPAVRARIDAYVRHLAAQLVAGPCTTLLIGLDRAVALAPVSDAPARWCGLVEAYALARSSPWLCPPKTAWLAARDPQAHDAIDACWARECDPWWRALLGGAWDRVPSIADFPGATSVFGDADFPTLAQRIVAPMVAVFDESAEAADRALGLIAEREP